MISFKIIKGRNEPGDRRKTSYELVTVEAEYKRSHKTILFIWEPVFHGGWGEGRREGGREADTSQCQYLFYLKETTPGP